MKYHQRQKNIYISGQTEPFPISRSKIDLFLECPRCFYLDRKLGLGRTSMPSFSLNSAVDTLLKNEFDFFRQKKQPHPLMKQYNINAIPYEHSDLPHWRDDYYKYIGASFLHKPTNLLIRGIIDDIWINDQEELMIVDYKSTSTSKDISLEDEYKQGYKKQIELYQWIFRQNGFKVSNSGYFVFANGIKNNDKHFNGKIDFKMSIIPHIGNTDWIEPTILDIKKCLESTKIPKSGQDCEYCEYRRLISQSIKTHQTSEGHLDELYNEAISLFKSRNRVNPVLLQRIFHIGFPRAQRIIDEGIEQGIIDPETKTLLSK